MIGTLKKIFALTILLILSLSIIACGSEPKAILSLPGSVDNNGCLTLSVSSSTESIDLNDYMIFNEKSKVKFYSSEEMKDEIDSVITLNTGDNYIYVKVKEGLTKNNYTVNIVRRVLHSVSFDSNGGTSCATVYVDNGFAINPPETIREGYDFLGWGYDFTSPISTDLQLIAQWTPKKFTISSSDFDDISVDYDANYSLPKIDKKGYKFIKWVDSNGNDFSESGTWKGLQNTAVSAVFEKEIYTITYILGASLPNSTQTYTVDDTVALSAPTAPEGLNFLGWYASLEDETAVSSIEAGSTGNKTFYAKWIADEEIEHKLTVDADGQDFDKSEISVYYGSSYTLPTVQNKEGYTYNWILNGEEIPSNGIWALKSDATVSLKWTPVKYSITYNTDVKTTNPNTTVEFTVETDTITLVAPTRPNAVFVGWFTTEDFQEGTAITSIQKGTCENVILYAKFDITYHTVTYDPNGGSVQPSSSKFEIGDEYQLAIPTRENGISFIGWYTDLNNEETKLPTTGVWSIEQSVTVFAKWQIDEYTITLNSNGAKEEIKYTIYDTVTLPTKTATGFVFMGWKEAGSTAVYQHVVIGEGTTGNKEYTAVFSRFEYSFDATNKTATVSRYIRTTATDSVIIPANVNFNGVDYTVTAIGPEVFRNMGQFLTSYTSNFAVEIPKTLKSIGENAFTNCTDVTINVILDAGVDLNAWADSLIVASGNNQVVDVIKALRPAIGWSIYG